MRAMSFAAFFKTLLTLFFVVATLTGCGKNSKSSRDDLAALGVAYQAYHDLNGQGPATADDFIQMLSTPEKQESFAASDACKSIQNGDFVLNPGLKFRELKDLGKVVMIFEKKVPTEGGLVVLADATVAEMKPAEFAALDSGEGAKPPRN